jgi:hypothetical protein
MLAHIKGAENADTHGAGTQLFTVAFAKQDCRS